MYKTLHKNTRRVYRPCTVHRNSDTIGCERTEPGSCSETMQEPKPVRGETRLPSSYGFLTCLFANWVGGGLGERVNIWFAKTWTCSREAKAP